MTKQHTLVSLLLLCDSLKITVKLDYCFQAVYGPQHCNSLLSSVSKTAILLQASAHCEHGLQKVLPKHTSRPTFFLTHMQGLGQGEAGEGAHCQQQNWT